MNKITKTFQLIVVTGLVFGCEQPIEKRQYTEVFREPSKKQRPFSMDDPHSFMRQMPDDDIHANVNRQPSEPTGPNQMTMQPGIAESMDQSPLKWTTPKEWSEKKGSGIRLVTFTSGSVETSIVSLSGSAGGLGSNVIRWMRQIGIPAPNPADLDQFLKKQDRFQTQSQLPVVFIDLTELQTGDDVSSMIAGVIDRGTAQIFIKMTGPRKDVAKNKSKLRSLIKSITPIE